MRVSALVATLALIVTACGGGTADTAEVDTNIVDAGSFQVELPDEIVVVDEDEPEAREVADDTGAVSADIVNEDPDTETAEDPDAIPLDQSSDPVSELFTAFDDFQSCMERVGREFIGIPDPEVPETVDPEYIADLQTCAAESGILEAQSNLEAASAERTLEEVTEPVQDEFGSLQLGGGDGDGFGLTPPPGEQLTDNPTLRECAADAQRLADVEEAESS